MRRERMAARMLQIAALTATLVSAGVTAAQAQDRTTDSGKPAPPAPTAAAPAQPARSSFEVYGFAMLDFGYNFKTINPNWFDTMRLTRLPSFEDEFGANNTTFAGVRQSRFGVRSSTPTDLGDLKTTFEFEMFGVGVDEGQTTIRLRHAYGEIGQWLAGQTWSPFMDPDVFPNSLEYWGPTGMVFFRNVQLRWTPISTGGRTLMVAIERPGASGDAGVYADRVELQGIQGRNVLPDFSGAYKWEQKWGYLRAAGMLREMKWDDLNGDAFDLSGRETGWGINVSSNIKASKNDVVRLQYVFGEGVQNYMNDSPIDVGIVNDFDDPLTPIKGKASPIQGLVAFVDHTWSPEFSSTVGYSWQENDNTEAQAPSAFRTGHYFLANILHYPAPNVMVGGEFQWGRRENFSDGFKSDGIKIQASFKYNFSVKIGG